jgi:phosphoribosylformylglycinamidine cyclo-ligase
MFPYKWMMNLNVFALSFLAETTSYAQVKPGDLIWGWPSYGPAANGFSLLRKVLGLKPRPQAIAAIEDLFRGQGAYTGIRKSLDKHYPRLGMTLREALLEPTPIWISQIEEQKESGVIFSGHAHITGGGLIDNVPRILPPNYKAVINLGAWTRPPIFPLVEKMGQVGLEEMLRTFNNGVMVASIVSQNSSSVSCKEAFQIGCVSQRDGQEPQVQFIGKFRDE